MSELVDAMRKIRAKKDKLISDMNLLLQEFTDETSVVISDIDIQLIVDAGGRSHASYIRSMRVGQ